MAFTNSPLEWIVIIFAVVTLIKLIVLIFDRKSWWPVTKAVYGNKAISGIVFFIGIAFTLISLMVLRTMTLLVL